MAGIDGNAPRACCATTNGDFGNARARRVIAVGDRRGYAFARVVHPYGVTVVRVDCLLRAPLVQSLRVDCTGCPMKGRMRMLYH